MISSSLRTIQTTFQQILCLKHNKKFFSSGFRHLLVFVWKLPIFSVCFSVEISIQWFLLHNHLVFSRVPWNKTGVPWTFNPEPFRYYWQVRFAFSIHTNSASPQSNFLSISPQILNPDTQFSKKYLILTESVIYKNRLIQFNKIFRKRPPKFFDKSNRFSPEPSQF